ncbi:MAG: peptide transporter, partial [Kiritimatiellia bacterium]
MARVDKELEQYRNLLKTPDTYEEGFGWTTIIGIFFCGAIMMPGAIYLGLMTGGTMGSAATWVTVILFSEVTRRAMKTMSKGNLIVLLHAAGVMMAGSALIPGGPFGGLVYRAFLVTSDAARDMGMRDYFPTWWCPKPDSPAITER